MVTNLHNNLDVRIKTVNGKEELVIGHLMNLKRYHVALHNAVKYLINDSEVRAEDIHISICTSLLENACNIGLKPLISPDL